MAPTPSIKLIGVPDKTSHNQDFDMHIGESKLITVTLSNIDGSVYDPTGMEMEWWLATTSHSWRIIQKDITSGGITVAANVVTITLNSDETYDLKPELYYHELKVFDPDAAGFVSVALTGTAQLRHAVDMRLTAAPTDAVPGV